MDWFVIESRGWVAREGWLVQVSLRNLNLGWFNSMWNSWIPTLNLLLGCSTLLLLRWNWMRGMWTHPQLSQGWRSCVWLYKLSQGSVETKFTLFFGKLDQLFFDLARWWLPRVSPFLVYSTKLGRKWITIQEVLKRSIPNKWRSAIPPSTSPSWNIIWHEHKAQKGCSLPLANYL